MSDPYRPDPHHDLGKLRRLNGRVRLFRHSFRYRRRRCSGPVVGGRGREREILWEMRGGRKGVSLRRFEFLRNGNQTHVVTVGGIFEPIFGRIMDVLAPFWRG